MYNIMNLNSYTVAAVSKIWDYLMRSVRGVVYGRLFSAP